MRGNRRHDAPSGSRLSRREFLRGAGLGGAAVALWPGALAARDHAPRVEGLRALAWQGLAARFETPVPEAYRRRLVYELDVITRLGFTDDVLRLHELVAWARGQRIPVLPGYGHAAASLALWALGLNVLDPVALGLHFELFIND